MLRESAMLHYTHLRVRVSGRKSKGFQRGVRHAHRKQLAYEAGCSLTRSWESEGGQWTQGGRSCNSNRFHKTLFPPQLTTPVSLG